VAADLDVDVLIAGAGPAGCAMALSLADFAPRLRVGLVSAERDGAARIGETVPPPIEPLLRHLGVWDAFMTEGHVPSYRTSSAWGSPFLASNEFLFQARQVGWRLDRARFDAMLRRAAARRVMSFVFARVVDLDRADPWCVHLDSGAAIAACFVVDATGRAARLVRSQGVNVQNLDRLVGCTLHIEDPHDDGEGLLVETFADGWWYSAALPGGRRVVACLTDADEVRALALHDSRAFMKLLDETRHLRRFSRDASAFARPRLWSAGSRRPLKLEEGLPLLAIGDAGSCFDPVSGQGIVKALRSGIFASYAVADWLERGDGRGLERYKRFAADEFDSYWSTLHAYYALERRWNDRRFWRRRHRAP
jgi:flavin-dependent dehydrogenase